MLHWCNEVIGANEAEDLLTANCPISRLALFEDKHTLATGTNRGGSQYDKGLHRHFGVSMQHYTVNRVCIMLMYVMSHSHCHSMILTLMRIMCVWRRPSTLSKQDKYAFIQVSTGYMKHCPCWIWLNYCIFAYKQQLPLFQHRLLKPQLSIDNSSRDKDTAELTEQHGFNAEHIDETKTIGASQCSHLLS